MTHTPEKEWLYNKTTVFADNGLRYKAITGPMAASASAQVNFDAMRMKTNARIVACVNACTGLADPAKEIEELRKTILGLRSVVETIQPYSRRYCDGRSIYATEEHNIATDCAIRLGCVIKDDPIAKSKYANEGTLDEPRTETEEIAQLRSDCRVLAEEVAAYRKLAPLCSTMAYGETTWFVEAEEDADGKLGMELMFARKATDNSGAFTRHKEQA